MNYGEYQKGDFSYAEKKIKIKKIKFPKVCAYKNQLWKGQMFRNSEHNSCFWKAQTPLWGNRIIITAPKVQVDCSLGRLRMACGKFSQGSGGVSCFCQKWPQAWLSQNEPWSLRALTERWSPDLCVSLTPHLTNISHYFFSASCFCFFGNIDDFVLPEHQ